MNYDSFNCIEIVKSHGVLLSVRRCVCSCLCLCVKTPPRKPKYWTLIQLKARLCNFWWAPNNVVIKRTIIKVTFQAFKFHASKSITVKATPHKIALFSNTVWLKSRIVIIITTTVNVVTIEAGHITSSPGFYYEINHELVRKQRTLVIKNLPSIKLKRTGHGRQKNMSY